MQQILGHCPPSLGSFVIGYTPILNIHVVSVVQYATLHMKIYMTIKDCKEYLSLFCCNLFVNDLQYVSFVDGPKNIINSFGDQNDNSSLILFIQES